MKWAWMLHGTDGSGADYYWFKDIKIYLEGLGYKVWWPQLPNTEKPNLIETEDYISDFMPEAPNSETVIIAHSSACPVILDFLLWLVDTKVKMVILVSGFYQSIDDDGFSELMLPKQFNWDAIRKSASNIVLINSDNDPWGCDDKQARPVAKMLEAKFILAKGQGHMGSASYSQPYKEFPLLKTILED